MMKASQHDAGRLRDAVAALLTPADIRINGGRPWDIAVHDRRFYRRALAEGSLGIGESYVDGWWDCERLDELFARAMRAGLDQRFRGWGRLQLVAARLINLQSRRRARRVGRQHYDLDVSIYAAMLDPLMIYSCGYWAGAEDLESAQRAKLDLVADKLGLAPGMRVLDVGCGWGGAAEYLARTRGVSVTGVTISAEQARIARERCAGLDVRIRLEDYRETGGQFDRVFSIGMFEHVGQRNYRDYFRIVQERLAPGGRFLLHTIGTNRAAVRTDPWIERYIFPNSMLPSVAQVTRALEGRFVLDDWHNFGTDYDRTLMAWHANFERNFRDPGDRYGERFRRLWRYYLLSCAGAFRARENHVWQLLLSPLGADRPAYRPAPERWKGHTGGRPLSQH